MVTVSKFYSRTIRQGAVPSNPGNVDQPDAIPPVLNPPGSGNENHLPVTIGVPSNGLSVDFSNQILTLNIEGVRLNGRTIGGVKRLIEETDLLEIPLNWEYNIYHLQIEGIIDNDGEINFN